jgi:hypothetical protein
MWQSIESVHFRGKSQPRKREWRKDSETNLTSSTHHELLFVSFESAINWFLSVTSLRVWIRGRGGGCLLPGYSIWQLRIDWQAMCHPDKSMPLPATFLSALDGAWRVILKGRKKYLSLSKQHISCCYKLEAKCKSYVAIHKCFIS